jgi:hypothetical protein
MSEERLNVLAYCVMRLAGTLPEKQLPTADKIPEGIFAFRVVHENAFGTRGRFEQRGGECPHRML